MAKYINKYTNIEAYNADDGKQYPNVSYLVDEDIIKWNKYDPDHIVAVYNVTSTSEATKLLDSTTGITYQIIDDVKQDTVQTTYTFETLGKHIVKYRAKDIGNYLFKNCTSLTNIIIGNYTKRISVASFVNCTGLKSVIMLDITNIAGMGFSGCSGLTSVTIPNSVTSIAYYAFINCSGLTSVTVEATTPPSLGDSAFSGTNDCPIYVPAESVDAYKTATNWSKYADRIQPISE